MSFIGIICENKNEKLIKEIFNNIKNRKIIIFNEDNIENFKNITFETIAIISSDTKILDKNEILKNIISKAKYLIVNADIYGYLKIVNNMNLNILTYGFNSKSTITASSVDDENILICIQRNIFNINNIMIEPQEIKISKKNNKLNTALTMGVTAILLLYGIDIKTM